MTGCRCVDGLFGENRKEEASSEIRGKQMWGGCKRQKKKKEREEKRVKDDWKPAGVFCFFNECGT